MIGKMFTSWSGTKLKVSLLMVFLVLTLVACATVPPPVPPKPATIAVVLGGGGSKGFAHIGVLKVLEAQKIPIHMVVGTSAGSLVGSLYASGKTAFELQGTRHEDGGGQCYRL